MRVFYCLILMLVSCCLSAQVGQLEGKWILDNTVYDSGKFLEINHKLFSQFGEYDFLSNRVKINGHESYVTYKENKIISDFQEWNYSFDNGYLLLQAKGENMIKLFLRYKDYLRKYPEFKAQYQIRNGDTVFVANDVLKPDFHLEEGLQSFLLKLIPSYKSLRSSEKPFNAEFVLLKTGKITDVVIKEGLTASFNEEFLNALEKANAYFKNSTDVDLLIKVEYYFRNLGQKNHSDLASKLHNLDNEADALFYLGQFEKAISKYQDLLEIERKFKHLKMEYLVEGAKVRMGVCYLGLNQKDKACEIFENNGALLNFETRNYYRYFCK